MDDYCPKTVFGIGFARRCEFFGYASVEECLWPELSIAVSVDGSQESKNREIAERASAQLLRDLQHPPSLEMMAREVGLTTFQLSRLFGRMVGKSIPALLREKRMQRAGELLRSSGQHVGDVAFSVGYYSISAFSRAFSREMGMTPSEYRKPPAEKEAYSATAVFDEMGG